jgi:hypothetical protein
MLLPSTRDAGIMEGLDLSGLLQVSAAVGVRGHLTVNRFGSRAYASPGAIEDATLRIGFAPRDANGSGQVLEPLGVATSLAPTITCENNMA